MWELSRYARTLFFAHPSGKVEIDLAKTFRSPLVVLLIGFDQQSINVVDMRKKIHYLVYVYIPHACVSLCISLLRWINRRFVAKVYICVLRGPTECIARNRHKIYTRVNHQLPFVPQETRRVDRAFLVVRHLDVLPANP